MPGGRRAGGRHCPPGFGLLGTPQGLHPGPVASATPTLPAQRAQFQVLTLPCPSAWTRPSEKGTWSVLPKPILAAAHPPWPHTLSGLVALAPCQGLPTLGQRPGHGLSAGKTILQTRRPGLRAPPPPSGPRALPVRGGGGGFSGCGRGQVGAGPWKRILSWGFRGSRGLSGVSMGPRRWGLDRMGRPCVSPLQAHVMPKGELS